ncbi:MAG TPA: spore coat protein [Oscillospiraceae bacterium]|nr:spore coat protein [Oscillospiraceae bacterium]HPS34077.1 spore coat protein [Oscillospiraceae bacterium]
MTTSLTSKELCALDEQLGTEQLLVKRCRAAATACTDPSIKQHFTTMADSHQKHYDTLRKFLG